MGTWELFPSEENSSTFLFPVDFRHSIQCPLPHLALHEYQMHLLSLSLQPETLMPIYMNRNQAQAKYWLLQQLNFGRYTQHWEGKDRAGHGHREGAAAAACCESLCLLHSEQPQNHAWTHGCTPFSKEAGSSHTSRTPVLQDLRVFFAQPSALASWAVCPRCWDCSLMKDFNWKPTSTP